MNREIKFRDYDLESKQIRYFDLDHYDKNEHDCYGNIMQFTGLKDKNGKEIYEGDICAYSRYANWESHNSDGSDSRMIGAVSFGLPGHYSNGSDFHAGTFYLKLLDKSKYSSSSYPAEHIRLNQTNSTWGLEVIGNIHQNPELL